MKGVDFLSVSFGLSFCPGWLACNLQRIRELSGKYSLDDGEAASVIFSVKISAGQADSRIVLLIELVHRALKRFYFAIF